MVGLLPMCATTVIEADLIESYPEIAGAARKFVDATARTCWSNR